MIERSEASLQSTNDEGAARRGPGRPRRFDSEIEAQLILDAGLAVIRRNGYADATVSEILEEAAISSRAFYRHFPSKDELALAFLERREELWTKGQVEAGARRASGGPEDRLLAIFDVFDVWFRSAEFEGCSFINVLLEMTPRHGLGQASINYLANIRSLIRTFAEEACLRDPESFARSFHILMKGSIVSAAEGDTEAAQRAKAMARLLIAEHR